MVSDYENFGVVIAEAIMRGLPVVISRFVGIAEFVQHHKVGIVIDSQNPSVISEAVLAISSEYSAYRDRCKDAASDLSWTNCINQWKDLFDEVS